MHKIYLLGISGDRLTPEQEGLMDRCSTLFAASRYASLVADRGKTVLPVVPVKDMLEAVDVKRRIGDVAVLTSGDPLFFGLGRKMLAAFGSGAVDIFPGLSSMQLAFSRFKEPWDDAVFLSLHGRNIDNPARLLLEPKKLFVLTDRSNSPAKLAGIMLEQLRQSGREDVIDSYAVFVGENLGMADERLCRGGLEEISQQNFGDLNVMIIKRESGVARPDSRFGLKEDDITHSRGLITKDEIRAATLHGLRLPAEGVFWDVGAGSGSVSVEAARLCPGLDVFAVEKNDQELGNIKENIRKYGLYNVTPVEGEAPEALGALPSPDRVFIGGSGGRMTEIIPYVAGLMTSKGRIVVNGVLDKTKATAPAMLHKCGFEVTISEISVKRRHYPAPDSEAQILNTIAVITGKK